MNLGKALHSLKLTKFLVQVGKTKIFPTNVVCFLLVLKCCTFLLVFATLSLGSSSKCVRTPRVPMHAEKSQTRIKTSVPLPQKKHVGLIELRL